MGFVTERLEANRCKCCRIIPELVFAAGIAVGLTAGILLFAVSW